MDYETCFVYQPPAVDINPRPTKRQRGETHQGLHQSWPRRRQLYDTLWKSQEEALHRTLSDLDGQVVQNVTDYVLAQSQNSDDSKLASAILVTGPNLASQATLTRHIGRCVRRQKRTCFVTITSTDASNLKAVLKRVNSVAIATDNYEDDDDDDEQFTASRGSTKLLNYDLRITQQFAEDQGLGKIVIAFQDCEAIDGTLLSDLVELFSCWKDRIPFALVFGIATSVETLQIKLSKRATRCIRGRRFDTTDDSIAIEQIADQIYSPATQLYLGPDVCKAILERQRDYLQTPQTAIDSIQYGYMTHFYANALSLILDPDIRFADVPQDHLQALHHLPSFMKLISSQLEKDRTIAKHVHGLLESDETLFQECQTRVRQGQTLLWHIVSTARYFGSLCSCLPIMEKVPTSNIVLMALSAGLSESVKMRELFVHLRKADSNMLQQLLDQQILHEVSGSATVFGNHKAQLTELLSTRKEGDPPLRSQEDIQNSTRRTTVIAKKIELSKAKTTLTEADAAYSEILSGYLVDLKDYFTTHLIDPKSLPFHEIFLFDLKNPYRSVFTPRPRHAIERALSAPHDYLNCDCCASETGHEANLAATMPPSAIMYQLYLESGNIINAADLRAAFTAIVAETVGEEEVVSALFQRSLAELSHLGLVKSTKKRADHVLKQTWKGL